MTSPRPISAQRLELRPVRPRHIPAVYALTEASRAHLAPRMPWIHSEPSLAATAEFVRQAMVQEASGLGAQFGIWQATDLAGVIGYHPIRWTERHADIGYWLGPSFEGQGLVSRSVCALLNQAFFDLGLSHIGIQTAEDNVRSQRVADRLGFRRLGVVAEGEWFIDHWVPSVVFQLSAAEWLARPERDRLLPAVIRPGSALPKPGSAGTA